jgi:hypothetical protein
LVLLLLADDVFEVLGTIETKKHETMVLYVENYEQAALLPVWKGVKKLRSCFSPLEVRDVRSEGSVKQFLAGTLNEPSTHSH